MIEIISTVDKIQELLAKELKDNTLNILVTTEPEKVATALAARRTVFLLNVAPEIEFFTSSNYRCTWQAYVIDGANRDINKALNNLMPVIQIAHKVLDLDEALPFTYTHPNGQIMPGWELKFITL